MKLIFIFIFIYEKKYTAYYEILLQSEQQRQEILLNTSSEGYSS